MAVVVVVIGAVDKPNKGATASEGTEAGGRWKGMHTEEKLMRLQYVCVGKS